MVSLFPCWSVTLLFPGGSLFIFLLRRNNVRDPTFIFIDVIYVHLTILLFVLDHTPKFQSVRSTKSVAVYFAFKSLQLPNFLSKFPTEPDNFPIFFTFRRGKLSKIPILWDKIVKISIFWGKISKIWKFRVKNQKKLQFLG